MNKIIIKNSNNDKQNLVKNKEWINENKFIYKTKGKYSYSYELLTDEITQIEKELKKRKIKYSIIDNFAIRSNDYRKEFFKINKGIFNKGKYYHCSYCGKIIKKDKITVDHLIPISKVQKNKLILFLTKKLGLKSINDIKNLIPACKLCNTQKKDKTGFWIIWGFLGKNFLFWILIYILLILFIIILIYLINYLNIKPIVL